MSWTGPGPVRNAAATTSATSATPIRPVPEMSNRPQHVLDLACKVFQAALGGLGFLGPDGELHGYLTYGVAEENVPGFLRSPWATAVVERILDHAGPIRQEGPDALALGAVPAGVGPLGSFLAVPLAILGPPRAAFYVVRAAGRLPFTEHDEHLMTLFAGALEQGHLGEEARLVTQLGLLNRLSQAAAGTLDRDALLAVALRELERHLPLHTCVVWLSESAPGSPGVAEPPPAYLVAHTSPAARPELRAPLVVAGARVPADEPALRPCLEEGTACYADWACPEDRQGPLAQDLGRRGATAQFAVPLRGGDRTLGVLQCLSGRRGFTGEQVQLLHLVADLLGPAVSNCRLYGQLHAAYDELRRTQGQLVLAEKMRAVGELAGGVAHEFNNALCGVLGFLELALNDPGLAKEHRGHLLSARRCALGAARVVRRVQDFSCRRRDEAAPRWVDLNALVRRGVELVRHKWEITGPETPRIRVEVRTEASAGVEGHPDELREVLTNLVFNAVEAMPQGGTLTLRTWACEDRVYLSVADTGVGISEEARRRLFEPFFTTKGSQGTGLGLTVVFTIVQRHGGEIEVASRAGAGSTFTVSFPAAAAPAPPPEEATDSATGLPSRGLNLLVVEDEEAVRRFLHLALTRLGHRLRIAADVASGKAALEAESFDVVLTDLGLPDGSGEEVVRTAARLRPGTPVVLLTGWADQMARKPDGVARLLGKPVTLDTLARTLAEVAAAAPVG